MSRLTDVGLRLISWNVNRLGDKIKRGIVLQFLKRHSPDVVLLQETHLKGNVCNAMSRLGYHLTAHFASTSGSRGVGIMLRKSFPMTIDQTHTDPEGIFAVLSGTLEGQRLHLQSIYAPPGLQAPTFTDLGKLLLELPEGRVIIGGDFNSIVSDVFDRWPRKVLPPSHKQIHGFLNAMGLN